MRALSLFTGYGGIDLALQDYVTEVVAYVEIEEYAQKIIAYRMADGSLKRAPILADVKNVNGQIGDCDIIYGGFPCQDISVAGNGKGLAGERSGLFYEIIRLTKEIRPTFVFLENVPAIRTRGLEQVIKEFTQVGYDCRWTCLSAASVGANHKRERWFLLAYSNSQRGRIQQVTRTRTQQQTQTNPNNDGSSQSLVDPNSYGNKSEEPRGSELQTEMESVFGTKNCSTREFSGTSISQWPDALHRHDEADTVADPDCLRKQSKQDSRNFSSGWTLNSGKDVAQSSDWWTTEPDVGRVANGTPFRLDRIKALGNGVVPLQAKTAFEKLIGLT